MVRGTVVRGQGQRHAAWRRAGAIALVANAAKRQISHSAFRTRLISPERAAESIGGP